MNAVPDHSLTNSYARLPAHFYARIEPTPVAEPVLARLNTPLAETLGLNPARLRDDDWVQCLAGNRVPEGMEPLAMAYGGHQFGNWVPQLGDGRAILLGEIVDRDGVRRDIHLKGAGRTPFSRQGDGRAALGPVIREYLVSEAMAALGIPTTRSLAILTTGEQVMRERPLPGGILVRVATSHVRIGTFEYFHHRGDTEAVRVLADYVIERLYPQLKDAANPYCALLETVVTRTAELVAQWMMVGFIHGVMNTDNMAISGETLDFGPCAFLDDFHPDKVFSSIDWAGRYAYNQQPGIAHWNLAQLAGTLLPLLGSTDTAAEAAARQALDGFVPCFEAAYINGWRRKLGLAQAQEGDLELAHDLLRRMARAGADFTLTFRRLCDLRRADDSADGPVRELFDDPRLFDEWVPSWRQRLLAESADDRQRRAAMRQVNPAFIPRNHRVEQAIEAAVERRDWGPLDELMTVLAAPFEDHPALADYARPPEPGEEVTQTFCGT